MIRSSNPSEYCEGRMHRRPGVYLAAGLYACRITTVKLFGPGLQLRFHRRRLPSYSQLAYKYADFAREAAMDANELTDRERAILAFVKHYFEQNNMPFALRMLDSARIDDVRQIINGYRGLYEREAQH